MEMRRELGNGEEIEHKREIESEREKKEIHLYFPLFCCKTLKSATSCNKILKYTTFCRDCHKILNILTMRK